MRTASGHYRIDPPASGFFTASVLRLLVREAAVRGRFGRNGFLWGHLSGTHLEGRWSDSDNNGWIAMDFDGDYKNAEIRYGVEAENAAGAAWLHKIVRRSSRAKKAQIPAS